LLSSIACFYYIRIVKIMFFIKNSKNNLWLTHKSKQNTEIMIGCFLFFVLCLFLYPNLIVNFSTVVGLILF
jgi:NADH:ubiquinone oxidoreductase subunit 2 (subunit N)